MTINSQDINVNEILIITTFELFKRKIIPATLARKLAKMATVALAI